MKDHIKQLWDKAVEFHGHSCPGLAIGFKAALIAYNLLEIEDYEEDENILCLAETDACGIDGVQIVLKATLGSGSLRVIYKGKNAYSFYNRSKNKSVRIVFKGIDKKMTREEGTAAILKSADEEYFEIKYNTPPFPQRAIIYNSIKCSECNEMVAENAIHYINDKPYCIDCKDNI